MAGSKINRLHQCLVIGALSLTVSACAGPASPTPVPSLPATPLSSPVQTIPATATRQPAATLTATTSPILTTPQMIILADHLSNPDDLLLAPDGSIYVSDVGDGTVRRYTTTGGLQPVLSGLAAPEGMVILPDGSLVIAEQGKNRLVRYDPGAQTLTIFLDLTNTTGQDGVDGIAWDAYSQTIIVPDSPNGTILQVSPDAKTIKQIASGFVRPTGAWAEPDGSILVADEHGDSLDRLHTDGSLEKLATLSFPDDVIEDNNGNILVCTLGDNAIHLITSGTRKNKLFTVPLGSPQGIVFDTDGNLIVTDPGNHRLLKLIIH